MDTRGLHRPDSTRLDSPAPFRSSVPAASLPLSQANWILWKQTTSSSRSGSALIRKQYRISRCPAQPPIIFPSVPARLSMSPTEFRENSTDCAILTSRYYARPGNVFSETASLTSGQLCWLAKQPPKTGRPHPDIGVVRADTVFFRAVSGGLPPVTDT